MRFVLTSKRDFKSLVSFVLLINFYNKLLPVLLESKFCIFGLKKFPKLYKNGTLYEI